MGGYVGGVDRLATQSAQGGQAAGVKKVVGAAFGVPARFTDPKAPAPPKVLKQEVKPMTPVVGLQGVSMPPPPLPNMPATPKQNAMGGQQPILTPGQFATHNLAQRAPAPLAAPVQAPNPFKQTSPAMNTANKLAAPSVMQAPKPMGQLQEEVMKRCQFSPAVGGPISGPAAPQAPQPKPVVNAAATVAPIATTGAAVAQVIAISAPLPAAAPPLPTGAPATPPATAQPKV